MQTDQKRCEQHKGYRTNSNIGALREFYLHNFQSGLLKRLNQMANETKSSNSSNSITGASASIDSNNSHNISNHNNNVTSEIRIKVTLPQLHIVDAFDIIRSRLHYKDEAYKLSHYLCNCEVSQGNFEYYETPAGREVLNGIMMAIGDESFMKKAVNPYKTYNSLNKTENCQCFE
jgi:hypothetical protein